MIIIPYLYFKYNLISFERKEPLLVDADKKCSGIISINIMLVSLTISNISHSLYCCIKLFSVVAGGPTEESLQSLNIKCVKTHRSKTHYVIKMKELQIKLKWYSSMYFKSLTSLYQVSNNSVTSILQVYIKYPTTM